MHVREGLAEGGGNAPLVGWVAEREQQADRDRLGPVAAYALHQPGDLLVGELLDHTLRADPLSGLVLELRFHQGPRLGAAWVVEAGAVLPADLEQVGESPGRDQGSACPALLQQRVRPDGHAVREALDVSRLGPGAAQHLLDGCDHTA
jgi:hypothetical protein